MSVYDEYEYVPQVIIRDEKTGEGVSQSVSKEELAAVEEREAWKKAAEEEAARRAAEEAEKAASESAEDSSSEGFWARLYRGLFKSRKSLREKLAFIFSGFSEIDDDFYEELEEVLISSDIGVQTTEDILDDLRTMVKERHIKEPADCRELLIESMKERMKTTESSYDYVDKTSVVFVVGVNGVGKTTTVGKLAQKLRKQKKKVLICAADTFRAAAVEQLTEWANRAQCDLIKGSEGSDPSAVVFDAVSAAKARRADVLLIDTAGRLHNKKNLMAELSKMNSVIDREYPDAYRETLLVLDATTGQNALVQAKEFSEVTDITGLVMTKMDGTAKGGICVAVENELHIPVKYIGVGEKVEDLERFNADQFVDALFAEEEE